MKLILGVVFLTNSLAFRYLPYVKIICLINKTTF